MSLFFSCVCDRRIWMAGMLLWRVTWMHGLAVVFSNSDCPVCVSQRPQHGFQVNLKLEVVDKRNPSLIRVATVEDIDEYRIKVNCSQ